MKMAPTGLCLDGWRSEVNEGLIFTFSVFRRFGVDVGLDKMGIVPPECNNIQGRNAAMRISRHVVVRANHEFIRPCVE